MKHHFWYSKKQAEYFSDFNKNVSTHKDEKWQRNRALIDGEIVDYTLMDSRKDSAHLWPDSVYLGEGEWHSSNGEY